jgi:hypothetical protein
MLVVHHFEQDLAGLLCDNPSVEPHRPTSTSGCLEVVARHELLRANVVICVRAVLASKFWDENRECASRSFLSIPT